MGAQWKFAFIVGTLLIAGAAAHVMRRDVATQGGEHTFSQLFDEAQKHLKTFEESVSKALGFNSPEELRARAADQGKVIAGTLDDWARNLKEQTESLKDNESIKDLRNSIDNAVNEWKAKNPETAGDLEKFVANTKEGSEKIVDKIKQIDQSEEAKQVKELTQKLLESSVQALQDAAKKIGENLKQN